MNLFGCCQVFICGFENRCFDIVKFFLLKLKEEFGLGIQVSIFLFKIYFVVLIKNISWFIFFFELFIDI